MKLITVNFGTGEAIVYPMDTPPSYDDCDMAGEIYVFNDLGYRHKVVLDKSVHINQLCQGVAMGWDRTPRWHIEEQKTQTLLAAIKVIVQNAIEDAQPAL